MTTEVRINKAFRDGVSSIVDNAQIGRLRQALDNGDVAGAIEAIDIDPAAFDRLRLTLIETYANAGNEALPRYQGAVVRWNSANPRVEAYARNEIGGMITGELTPDMVNAVRQHIADGYALGRTPNRMALDLVGRIGPGGHRKGGIVGLSAQQEEWVRNMRASLMSDDPASALRFSKRDKRSDRLLQSGQMLTQGQIDSIVRRYSNNLLVSRGRTIAKTERGKAINAGRMEAYKQAADKFGLPYDRIRKQWRHTGRAMRDRPTHMAANGQVVRGIDTPFDIGGVMMAHPHDPYAPAAETINCMCEVKLWLE